MDSHRYLLYGGTNRFKTCKNSFIDCKYSAFRENYKMILCFFAKSMKKKATFTCFG